MFQPGDILLYGVNLLTCKNIVPRLIQLIQGSTVIHVAIYVNKDEQGNHIICEALLCDGVTKKVFTETTIITRPDGFILLGTKRHPEIKNVINLDKIVAKYIGKKYAKLTIINILFQHGMSRILTKRVWTNWFTSKDAFICSQLALTIIEDVLKENNIPYTFTKVPSLTEPDDYLKNPWIDQE